MRIILFFDLPTKTSKQIKKANQFRNFLIKDGYYMLQFSVYVRICNGLDSVKKHKQHLKNNLPDNGSIKFLVITEKQYEASETLLGKPDLTPEKEKNINYQQLTIL